MSILYKKQQVRKFQSGGWWDNAISSAKGFAAENLGQDQWASHSPELVKEANEKAKAAAKEAQWGKNQRSKKGWNDNISADEVKAMQKKIGVKADGKWGDGSVKAYKKWKAEGGKNTETIDAEPTPNEAGFFSKQTLDKIGKNLDPVNLLKNAGALSSAGTAYGKYIGNSLARGYGMVKPGEALFEVGDSTLSSSERDAMRQAVIRANNKGWNENKGQISYNDYSSSKDVQEAGSSDKALNVIKSRGAKALAIPALSKSKDAVGESLSQLTGNANAYINDNGEIVVTDTYDFSDWKKKKGGKKEGATLTDLYNYATEDQYDYKGNKMNLWSKAHTYGENFEGEMPLKLNLGKATDFLSPEQIARMPKYKKSKNAIKDINILQGVGNALGLRKRGGILYKKL